MTDTLLINKLFPENTLSDNIKILQGFLSLQQETINLQKRNPDIPEIPYPPKMQIAMIELMAHLCKGWIKSLSTKYEPYQYSNVITMEVCIREDDLICED